MARLPALRAACASASTSKPSTAQCAAITSAAACGMTPTLASACASAASNSSMRAIRARCWNTACMASEAKSVSGKASVIEEHRLAAPLQNDVPIEGRLAARNRDQRCAPIGGYAREHWIGRVRRILGEVDARLEVLQHAAHEDRHVDVRRLHAAVGRGHATRLDRREAKAAGGVGRHAAEALESRLERQVA